MCVFVWSIDSGWTVRASEHEELTMTCRDDHMINVENAIYGNEEGKEQCASDQTTKLGERFDLFSQIIYQKHLVRCNSKQTCSIWALNDEFGGDPCPGVFKYLEVTYTCKSKSNGILFMSTSIQSNPCLIICV